MAVELNATLVYIPGLQQYANTPTVLVLMIWRFLPAPSVSTYSYTTFDSICATLI